jgi:D-alanyl-D-alanine dipeptidase
MKKFISLISVILLFSFAEIKQKQYQRRLPPDFVYLKDYIPNLKLDLRYYESNNFVGRKILGYDKEVCIVTKECALQLKKVNEELKKYDLTILIYDAYRPQKAVYDFVIWARDPKDTLMKQTFYQNIPKKDLFKRGFIASKSRHSSGSTVDLTLYSLKYDEVLDMGATYDYFGAKSYTNYQNINKEQRSNRLFLLKIMQKYGFRSYFKEWWHFTLKNEPFKDHYFDFDVL